MENETGTGFLRYAAGVHPKAFIKALVRASWEEYPYFIAISRMRVSVSRISKAALVSRLPAI